MYHQRFVRTHVIMKVTVANAIILHNFVDMTNTLKKIINADNKILLNNIMR
jgi:hypothetical protein